MRMGKNLNKINKEKNKKREIIKSSLLFDDERKTHEDGNYSAYSKKIICSTGIF